MYSIHFSYSEIPLKYSVKTKYFDAPITLFHYQPECNCDLNDSLEGVIVIATADKAIDSSFSIPSCITDSHMKLFIVLVNTSDTKKSDSEEKSPQVLKEERINWTLDNGFEYLEVDLSEPTKGKLNCMYINMCVV